MVGCTSTGLTDEERATAGVEIWYDNANLLVDINDPDLKADCYIGVPALDAVVDVVKDILVAVPSWAETKVEQKHFSNCYLESAKAINGGADGADKVVRGEAFKTVLLFDTIAQEVAHAKEAADIKIKLNGIATSRADDDPEVVALKAARRENYAKNAEVYEAAQAKVLDYTHNHIFPFQKILGDNEAMDAFFADSARGEWTDRTQEIVKKIMACVAKSDNEAEAKEAIAKLCKDVGVQEMDWGKVGAELQADLEKIQKAAQDFATALQEPTLQQMIAKAAFGGEIAPGTSGKETLKTLARVGKQLAANVKLITWLLSEMLVH